MLAATLLPPSNTLSTINPYTNNSQLTPLESEVLWEYAKLGDKIKRIANLAKSTAETPNESLLTQLRALEKKMGLVLTLYKASVWGVIQESQAEAELAQARALAERGNQSEYDSTYRQWNEDDSVDD